MVNQTFVTHVIASTLNILVVEDDSLVRNIICSQLIAAGHQPVAAENASEALTKFEAERFDLVITDRTMPGMNGNQLAMVIKKINPLMPILMLTGLGDLLDVTSYEEVDLIVCKPFTYSMLNESIAKIMNR